MANEQRDAIAQALMAQQATPESQALMLANPGAYYEKYGGAPDYHGMSPAEYGNLFTPKGMPSGGVDEQGAKLFSWAGYSDGGAGRAPGGILPFYGNGASAYGNPDYWFGNGPGAQAAQASNNSQADALAYMQATNPQRYQQMMELQQQNMQLYGTGPGNSGAAGMGGVGGAPSTGVSDAELGRAVADVNSQRGQPTQAEFSLSPFSHGFETYGRSAQDYNPVNDPYSFDTFNSQQSAMQQSHQAAEAMNAVQQAAQDAADDAAADAADDGDY